jgi:hypothetical protein
VPDENALDIPRFATLFDCYKPVERYTRLARLPGRPPIEPLDAFLMHQVAALYPQEPAVVDLAADATGGATAAFWAAHPAVGHVRVPPAVPVEAGGRGAWRRQFADVMSALAAPPDAWSLDDTPPALCEDDGPPGGGVPLLVSAFAPDTSPADVQRLLQQTLALYRDATVLLLGVGRAGDGPALEGAVSFCSHDSPHRLLLARELSPFFAASQLAVISARGDERAGVVLRRIAGTFEGNFQFLSLAEQVVTAAQRAEAAPESAAAPPAPAQPQPPAVDYPGLVERIRRAVDEQLPADAVVLAVSKGDEALLRLGGRPAHHFPEAERGGYAGFYPADDMAAVEQLERQRARGGQYLLFPATALWWLEHYAEFRRHLEHNYRVAVCRPSTCVVFDLRGADAPTRPAVASATAPAARPGNGLWGRLVAAVSARSVTHGSNGSNPR